MECPSHLGIVYNDITPGNILIRHEKVGKECPSYLGKLPDNTTPSSDTRKE